MYKYYNIDRQLITATCFINVNHNFGSINHIINIYTDYR